jgi:hypothetical protein
MAASYALAADYPASGILWTAGRTQQHALPENGWMRVMKTKNIRRPYLSNSYWRSAINKRENETGEARSYRTDGLPGGYSSRPACHEAIRWKKRTE